MRISRNVWLLGIVSLLNDAGSEMMNAVLPLFATSLGASGFALGMIGGLRDAAASFIKVFAGWWSDRIGKRKPFLWLGYGLGGVMKLVMSVATSWPQLLVISPIERMSKLRDPPRDALIADSVPLRIRGEAFGIQQAMDRTGAITGSLIALALVGIGLAFSPIIALGGLISLSSLVAVMMVKDKPAKPILRGLGVSLKGLPKEFKKYLAVSTLFALGNFTYFIFIARASGFFTGALATIAPVGLYVLSNVFFAAGLPVFGRISDRVGRKEMLFAGYLLFALVSVGFAMNGELTGLFILFAAYGLFNALIDSNQRAYVVDLVGHEQRGTALGAFHTAIGTAALPAGAIAGLLYQLAPAYAFLYGAGMGIASALLLLTVVRKR
jgi:MFS family permease